MMGLSNVSGQASMPVMMNNTDAKLKKPIVSELDKENSAGLSTEDLQLLSQLLATPPTEESKPSVLTRANSDETTDSKPIAKTVSGDVLRGQLPNIKETHLCKDTDCTTC